MPASCPEKGKAKILATTLKLELGATSTIKVAKESYLVSSRDCANSAGEEIGFNTAITLISCGLGTRASTKKQNLGPPALVASVIATVMMFGSAAYGL